MPTYKITDPATGRTLKVTGDHAPDGNDIEELFAQAKPRAKEQPPQESQPNQQEPSRLGKIAKTLLTPVEIAGNAISRVSDAPLRAGLSSAMEVEEANQDASIASIFPRQMAAFAKGYAGQFGRDPSIPPTGKELMAGAGLSTVGGQSAYPNMQQFNGSFNTGGGGISPAGLAGFALEGLAPMPGLGAVSGAAKASAPGLRMVAGGAAEGAGKAVRGAAKAADAVTGTRLGTGALNVAKDVVSGTADATKALYRSVEKTYGGKYDPEFKRMAKIAEKAGIDPESLPKSIKFGKNSVASKQQRHSMEAFGADEADKFDETLNQVQDAVRKEISAIGNGSKITGGKPLSAKPIPATKYEAGERIKSAYDGSVENYFKDLDVSYQKIAAENPGMKIPPAVMGKFHGKLDEAADYANKLVKNSFDDVSQAQGQQILKAVERARQSTGNYADFVDALQGVGRTAFKVKNTMAAIPPDVSRFRKMYGDMVETAVGAVKGHLGKDVADDLLRKNREMHELFGDKNILAQLGEVTKSPDKMVDAIMASPLRIKTIKKYLPEEEIQALKGRVLQDLIKENSEGEFAFRSLHSALHNKAKREALNALFDPGELADFQDLITLGDKFGPKALSTSGTGASNQITGLISKVAGAAGKPLQMAGAGIEKGLAMRQERAAAKGSRKVAPGPTMNFGGSNNFGGSPTLSAVAGLVNGKPRAKLSQMYYSNTKEDQ